MKCSLGECYEEIGRLYEEQPRLDWEHIADMMHDYKGLLAGWPQVLHIHSVSSLFGDSRPRSPQLPHDCSSRLCVQGAQGKRKEVEGENNANAVGVRKRGDAVSYSLLSEVTSSPC